MNPAQLSANLSLLLAQQPALNTLLKLFALNALISAIVALLFAYVFLKRAQREKLAIFLLLFCLGTFIPIFGIVLAIIAALLLKKYIKASHYLIIENFPEMNYTNEKQLNARAYGSGWARIRLASDSFLKKERERALININKYTSSEVNLLNRQLLSDDMDELRLYAFSLLDKQQNRLNKKIYQLLQLHQQPQPPLQTAIIEKQLAQLYWEMVYLNLAEKELRKLILEKMFFYANKAVQVLKEDATLWCLLAHYYQQNNQIQESLEALTTASRYHAPASKIYPYLAEFSFYQRDFAKVREYLDNHAGFRDIPAIGKIVEYWTTYD